MNSSLLGFEDLRERIVRLERQNRRLKQLGLAILAIAVVILLMGQTPSKKIIEANEFILRDDAGNIRARLFMTKETTTTAKELLGIDSSTPVKIPPEATLAMYDSTGQIRVMLNGSDIAFENAQGHLGGELGNGTLMLAGEQNSFAILSPYNLNLQDQDGFLATLGVTNIVTPRTGQTQKTSAASLVLFDKNKNVIWKAP
jgi:hypothetical protein